MKLKIEIDLEGVDNGFILETSSYGVERAGSLQHSVEVFQEDRWRALTRRLTEFCEDFTSRTAERIKNISR